MRLLGFVRGYAFISSDEGNLGGGWSSCASSRDVQEARDTLETFWVTGMDESV